MKGSHAWITSAVDDQTATKALILASSFRRVHTGKTLAVVVSTSNISERLRNKLKGAFHLVLPLEPESETTDFNLEDSAKLQTFSLGIFSKCVYLSPQTLVLRNCDEIFERNSPYAITGGTKDGAEMSVYIFTPSLGLKQAFETSVFKTWDECEGPGKFSNFLTAWIQNHTGDWEELGEEYNKKLALKGNTQVCEDFCGIVNIVNFADIYPIDLSGNGCKINFTNLGHVAKHAVEICWNLWMAMAAEDLVDSKHDLPLTIPNRVYEREPIAIVGLSFRLPGGNTPEEMWELLVNGREAIKPLPPFRWTKEHSYYPCNDKKLEAGFLDTPIDDFDAKFFGISPKEAVFLDPQQRLLHEVTWHALEDAGIDPHTLPKTQTGIFVGSWIYDYKDLTVSSGEVDFLRTYMGNSIAATAARLSHFLGTTGPSIATESGCSSSIVAVDMACKSLRNHDSNLAMACGVNLLIHPFDQHKIEMVIAPDGRCKTFDAKANGFGRAEGCTILVLKRLSDAVKDENRIWGLIRGSAITQEGVSKSLGTPTVYCESLAMKLALKEAGVDSLDVSYVEAHGTGTPVGDPLEIAAIEKVYSGKRETPLLIGSVKTNVGHTEAAAGITGMIKVLLALQHDTIPPHRNLDTLNPLLTTNLGAIPAEIPLLPVPWPRESNKPRFAGVSSFGISGGDGHVIIEEAPLTPNTSIDYELERPLHIMKVSAKCPESLQKLLSAYEHVIHEKTEEGNDEGFADMAFSANTGRSTFNHRAIIIAKDFGNAETILKSKTYKYADTTRKNGSICFLFTGQGSQYPDMASTLYLTSPVFRTQFNQCSKILENRYNIPIKDVLCGNGAQVNRTLFSQTSIFCVEYCLFKLWESWGVKPDFVLGHSLGEFVAAVAAGALNFEDALMLVAERSKLIDNLPTGKMLVIRADKKTVEKEIVNYQKTHPNFWADFAALNSSEQTVIAGDSNLIEDFAKHCADNSMKAVVLASTHAFHSRHMDPMLEAYRQVVSRIKSNEVTTAADLPKYISGMEGKLVDITDINAEYWVRHTREKVNFLEACKTVHSEDCNIFLEIGPHPVSSALMMLNLDGSPILCLPSLRRNEDDWTTLLDSLANLYVSEWKGEIDWTGFDLPYNRKRVALPFYEFNRKPVWVKIERLINNLHPLLGKIMPNASTQTIFESKISLKNLNFLRGHSIGSRIVFPAAAFLELILAGGYASVQGLTEDWTTPMRAIGVENLRIHAPLAISEAEPSFLQVVVTLEENENAEPSYSVAIYSNTDTDNPTPASKWLLHSTGTFQPVVQRKPRELSTQIDISSIKNECDKYENNVFYEKTSRLGFHLESEFRSLQVGWLTETGHLIQVKVPEEIRESWSSYVVHPILTDAMIQAAIIWVNRDNSDRLPKKIQVPVKIGEFTWLPPSESNCSAEKNLYVYCSTNEEGNTYSLLLTEAGTCLAHMLSVELVETSAKLIEGMIQQQSTETACLWEETWKVKPGPCQNKVDLLSVDFPMELPDVMERKLREHSDLAECIFGGNESDLLSCYLFLRALYRIGWRPEAGTLFTVDNLCQSLSIKDSSLQRFTRFFLRSLVRVGVLSSVQEENSDEFMFFERPPPTHEEISKVIEEIVDTVDTTRIDYKLTCEVGKVLHDVLTGRKSAMATLFSQDPSKPSLEDLYKSGEQHFSNDVFTLAMDGFVFNSLIEGMEKQQARSSVEEPVLRILDVGGEGTDFLTNSFVSFLAKKDIKFEYYYSDVSANVLGGAGEGLAKGAKHYDVVFKSLDMEEDPLEQGFCPSYFDCIVAFDVIHTSKDVCKTLTHLRTLLRPGGVIQILERITEDPTITFICGLLERYWRFEDVHLRQFHPTLPPSKWTQVLQSADFPRVVWRPAAGDGSRAIIIGWASAEEQSLEELKKPAKCSWLIFDDGMRLGNTLRSKLVRVGRNVVTIPKSNVEDDAELMERQIKLAIKKVSVGPETKFEGIVYLWGLTSKEDRDQTRISLPLLTLLQQLSALGTPALPKVFVVTQGIYNVQESLVHNPSAGTLPGLIRSVGNENSMLDITHLDLSPALEPHSQSDEVFSNLWVELKGGAVAFRNGKRLIPKLISAKIRNENVLSLPNGCQRFQLQLPDTRLISDLEFVTLRQHELAEDEVEIQLKAVALNFRDVFTVLKPNLEFEKIAKFGVGTDMAGIITKIGSNVTSRKVGDRVIGLNRHSISLPSHAKLRAARSVALPPQMTYAEGSSLPIIFSSCTISLVSVGKIKEGETVLIHCASGGFGLGAIRFANHFGATVIATAGSERKRNYLRSLGIQHVFHSRTTAFGKEVLEVTDGRGVDIVLNSLTGPGFKEASLDALATGGRFIEMSKLNVWTREEVRQRRPDVLYEVVDITKENDATHAEIATELQRVLDEDSMKPIPCERFNALNIRGALAYMQQAKHIGKVVCVMPEVKVDKAKVIEVTPLFNENSTYLVTGGLGGIGFEVVKWILRNGGKHVAIASRSQPNPEKQAQMSSWKRAGLNVQAFAVDVGNIAECRQLIENVECRATSGFPPLRGVMHAAGVLANATLENQSWETFRATYNPKVTGTWNLHDLTKHLPLEHFLLFSSITAMLGSPGQANHSASNSFEDTFAHFRKSIGLPAVSINWGNWGEVGVAADNDFPGVRPISTSQALRVLESIITTQTSHVAVLNVESFQLFSTLFPKIKTYLDDQKLLGMGRATVSVLKADEFWAQLDEAETSEKVIAFKGLIKTTLRTVLKLHADEDIDDEAEFQTLGVDSLMMLEMKNGLQNTIGQRMTLTAAQLKDCNTTETLSHKLTCLVEEREEMTSMPSLEELKQLIREDSVLDENIRPTEGMETKEIDKIETVLLTGGTGTLGPYLLAELTQREHINKVYCLIRKRGKHSAAARLQSQLKSITEFEDGLDMSKVECLEGDISDPDFGLSPEKYDELAKQVDVICHSAARTDHNAKYWRSGNQNKHQVRTANVLGTSRVLEFAVHRRLKHVLHVSTFLAAPSVDEKGHLSEDWEEVGAFDDFPENMGYPVSKHIAEQLMRQGIERGIPCKVVRLPFIGGDSRTGKCHFETNHLLLRLLAFMKLECMPEVPMPVPIIPVDKCAEVCVKLMFEKGMAQSDVIHVCERNPGVEQVVIEIAKEYGINIETVPFPDFLVKLETLDDNKSLQLMTGRYHESLQQIWLHLRR